MNTNYMICQSFDIHTVTRVSAAILYKEPSWPWSYGSWIYKQCQSPLLLQVRISIKARYQNIVW